MPTSSFRLLVSFTWLLLVLPLSSIQADEGPSQSTLADAVAHRSPLAIVLADEGGWLVSANETSHSISLVDTANGQVRHEFGCGGRPAFVALCLDGQSIVVSCPDAGQLLVLDIDGWRLRERCTIAVGAQPTGIAVAPSGQRAYVGLVATGEVATVDLDSGQLVHRLKVGNWPRYLALNPAGTRLAVGCSGDSKISVIDCQQGVVLYEQRLSGGINIGHMQSSPDGEFVYFPWMIYRSNPISPQNIRLGWVLASRIGRVRFDGPAYREAISLDVPRRAVCDPHGLVLSSDQHRLVVSASGTHELLVYRNPDLPYIGVGGPGDLIDRRLLADKDLFYRIDVGGRPLGLALASDDRTLFVANYVLDSIQVVDIESREIQREIPLGTAPATSLARQGMQIFYDGQRSLDQWYSCHSCHYEGGVNAKAMDTLNDGSSFTMKTVLPLHGLAETGPWTWHGWQLDLQDAMNKSFTTTMQGEPINNEEAEAVLAYLDTLRLPRNPFLLADGSLSAAAARGKSVFEKQGRCASCHSGPHFTDGLVHDVGLGSEEDQYEGFNTPSLRGLYRKVRYLHDGRAKSLDALLSGPHAPENVAGERLSEQELEDLIEYLKSL